ncbi:MAG: ABC transporter ATP-binding protein/permease [Actinobacteria bacterium]|nr:ABC transporter ATP-binding protein/permease [Actinomycetota bacterium]
MAMGGWFSGGGGMGRGGGANRGQEAGMPFAGIPPEMSERVESLLAKEPDHGAPPVSFSYKSTDTSGFKLTRFLAPHLPAILLAILLVVIEVVAEQIGPHLTKIAVDDALLSGNFRMLISIGVIYLFSIAINMIMRAFRTAWAGRIGEKLLFELRVKVFSHLQRLSIDFYTKEKTGRIMTRMTSDIDALQQLFHDGLINLCVQAMTLVFVTTMLFIYNARLAVVVLLGIVPVTVGMTLWFRTTSNRAFLAVRERISDILADLAENLSGIRIVAMYNRQRHNSIKHRNVVGRHLDANLHAARVSGTYGSAVETMGVVGVILILVVGGNMVFEGNLTVGELSAFVLYLNTFFAPIQQLVQLYSVYQQGRAAISKLRELLSTKPSVPEADDAYDLPPISGGIEFKDVTFGYLPDTPVLKDVSLHIPAGHTFALVGPTGAGKSTIAKLITRFYDPDKGQVLIDGHDLRMVGIESLRRQLGVVPQEPFLFAGSIRDNIAFSRPEAATDEILEACRAVGIDDLIDRLPQGLDTPCHERGVTLSSGERQLIALARAFLAQPRVIVLDEATSNLDLGTEAKIERALDILLEGRTAVLIAHRLSTAMRADRIAVIDDAGIIEMGSHDELLEARGRYADMFEAWMRHSTDASLFA